MMGGIPHEQVAPNDEWPHPEHCGDDYGGGSRKAQCALTRRVECDRRLGGATADHPCSLGLYGDMGWWIVALRAERTALAAIAIRSAEAHHMQNLETRHEPAGRCRRPQGQPCG